jgi:opacity protein-like surface antigen
MHLLKLLTPALLLSVAMSAQAEQTYYVGGRISYDDTADLAIDAGPILSDLSLDRDWGFGAVFGRQLSTPWRVEVDAMFRRTDALELPGLGLDELNGRLETRTVMLNLIADLPFENSSIVPYLGAGAGWASINIDKVGNNFLRIEGEDNSAYGLQGFVGFALPLADSLKLTVDARYTYIRADGLSYDIGPLSIEDETRVKTLSLLAGLQFEF